MEKQAFEPTGLIPRSIIRTVDRFVQQLLPGREKIALQEYRVSRYQILVSVKSLLTLVLIPILVSSTMKALLFTPLVEHFWNNNQSEIFLNQYQEKRAFSEMHDFSEKMFFESLLIEPKIRSNPLEIENLDTRNILNPPYSTVSYANELGTKSSKNQSINPFCSLYVARTKAHSLHQHGLCKLRHVPTFVALQSGTVCIGELCNGLTNRRFVLSTLLPLRDAPNHVLCKPTVCNGLQSGALYVRTNRRFVCKERGCRTLSLHLLTKRSFVRISKQAGFVPVLYGNNNKLLSYSHFTENDKYETLFQRKSLELAKSYNKQSILAITNLLGDFLTFFTVSVLFRIMRPELIILKSFLTESVYSLSDTTKSFLLILGMDLLVGFHSPRGWELLLEGFLRHIGLPENENFILLFVALFPVFLDTVFKYWIFRYLNKISPSTVVTYHSMIE